MCSLKYPQGHQLANSLESNIRMLFELLTCTSQLEHVHSYLTAQVGSYSYTKCKNSVITLAIKQDNKTVSIPSFKIVSLDQTNKYGTRLVSRWLVGQIHGPLESECFFPGLLSQIYQLANQVIVINFVSMQLSSLRQVTALHCSYRL